MAPHVTRYISVLTAGEWSPPPPGRPPPRPREVYSHDRWIGGNVGPQSGLDAVNNREISCFSQESKNNLIETLSRRFLNGLRKIMENLSQNSLCSSRFANVPCDTLVTTYKTIPRHNPEGLNVRNNEYFMYPGKVKLSLCLTN
jgi:hypothetical protein